MSGVVSLYGGWDSSGIAVTLSNATTSLQTLTDLDGSYSFDGVPPGIYQLAFAKSVPLLPDSGWMGADGGEFDLQFADAIPNVLSFPAQNAQVIAGGTTYPLEPFVVYPGQRTVSGSFSSYSPNATWATVLDGGEGGTLSLVNLWDGGTTQLGSYAYKQTQYGFSPDGSHIVFVLGTNSSVASLWLSDVAVGATPVQLASMNADHVDYEFSSDGRFLIYLDELNALWAVDLEASTVTPRKLATNGASYSGQEGSGGMWLFSASGSQLAFLANFDAGSGFLTLADLNSTAAPSTIASGVQSENFAFSPDSSQLAYLTAGNLLLAFTDGGTPQQVAAASEDLAFSPDGAWLSYGNYDPSSSTLHFYVASTSGVASPIDVFDAWSDVRATWSPDSAHLALDGSFDQTLYVWSLASGTTTAVPGPLPYAAPYLEWLFSPDGSNLVHCVSGSGLTCSADAFNVLDAGNVALAPSVFYQLEYSVAVSPDGTELYYLASTGGFGGMLERIPLDGSSSAVELGQGPILILPPLTVAFSPDRGSVAFTSDLSGILQLARMSKQASTLQLFDNAAILQHTDSRLAVSHGGADAPYEFQTGVYFIDPPQAAP